jgi:7-cyano-7-deazaguanine synthase
MIRAVNLLSGGIDSLTCLAIANSKYHREEIFALSLHYGQKHSRELGAAARIAAHYDVSHQIMSLNQDLFKGAGSTLIDPGAETPSETYASMDAKTEGISPTYIPFRNGNLLSAATALALTLHEEGQEPIELYYGAHAEDSANWAYPDCTPEFNGAMANAIYIGSHRRVRLVTPLQWMEKSVVVEMASLLSAPLHLSYSCYRGGENHCGTCPTCIARSAAFHFAGLSDPTTYDQEPG